MPNLWIATPFAKDECDDQVSSVLVSATARLIKPVQPFEAVGSRGSRKKRVPAGKQDSIAECGGGSLYSSPPKLKIASRSRASKYDLDKLPGQLYFAGVHYAFADVSFSSGDVLFLVAHGASDEDTDLYSASRSGVPMTIDDCFKLLAAADAENLSKIFFGICYSAEGGHCAPMWKQKYSQMDVYGMIGVADSPLSVRCDSSGSCEMTWVNPGFVKMR